MMVTFISQCEKNALNRTRRVLDAFANRIGDNTWQTVITEEGLDTTKKLLRKTACKNTAVSCHWIRSRSRSELVWVVGNKDRFNEMGIVPVNYTDNQLKLDETKMMTEKIYANTQRQPLDQHLFAVGHLAQYIVDKLTTSNSKNLVKSAFVAGCFHDIGKLDPAFQKWIHEKIKSDPDKITQPDDGVHIEKIVKKRFFDDHPRHNEISLLLFSLLYEAKDKPLNSKQLGYVKHAIYWHHARPIREVPFEDSADIYRKLNKSLKDGNFSGFYNSSIQMIKIVQRLAEKYSEKSLSLPDLRYKLDDDYTDDLKRDELPKYKDYHEPDNLQECKAEVLDNANNNLIRAGVVTADRIVSSLQEGKLNQFIEGKNLEELVDTRLKEESNLQSEIKSCLSGFDARYPGSKRNAAQSEAAKQLCEVESVAVLNGPAGCGKTKIALEWAANKTAKKIIWVCPRVQVCQGIYEDLTGQEYLPNTSIEIYTSEFKKIKRDGISRETGDNEVFSGDIVITTIDQVINSIVTHIQVTSLIDFMNAHVVFDEYHEFINMPAFNLLFAELVACKKLRGSLANTLLVSATPNYYFVNEFLSIHRDDIKGIESFNESKYKIVFDVYDDTDGSQSPLINNVQKENTFVITNTAKDAQLGFIKNMANENAILFHSKFTKADKQDLFDKVYQCFQKNGDKKFDVLRSGPIVQASLNISCDRMLTDFTCAENWLQRLGRLDRFGKNVAANEYITVLGRSIDAGKQQNNTARFLNSENIFQSAKAWHDFLKENECAEKEMRINEIYSLYEKFYLDKKSRLLIEQDFMNALKKSVKRINAKILDPMRVPSRRKLKDGLVKIKKQSLRGDNRFVQMAICYIETNGDKKFPDRYAYSEDTDHANTDVGLTASIEEITGYGDSDKNLVAYMKAKHHNIKADAAKAYKDFQILDAARSPENPIYLSYTPKDLIGIGGESQANSFAVYYAVCDKQSIGSISINKLNSKGE